MSKFRICLSLLLLFMQFTSSFAQVRAVKNINYAASGDDRYSLNVYHQKNAQNNDVIIFIHGGSWSSGKKETYWWLGRNFAKKKIVTAIINYPLAPDVNYTAMAEACAKAVKWVRDSISAYGGNPDRIFLMGHSAGAHLGELINADPQYFEKLQISNPIKGMILNDPFGLDMEEYLSKAAKDHYYTDFIRTFSADQSNWRLGSPLRYVKNIKNPHLMLYGTKTYDAIRLQSEHMCHILQQQHVPVQLITIPGKKHVGMISQMIWSANSCYQQILSFLSSVN